MDSRVKRFIEFILGLILIVLGIILGLLGGLIGFLGMAYITVNIFVMSIIAILLCLTVSNWLARIGGRKILPAYKKQISFVTGLFTCFLLIAISTFTIFKSLVPKSDIVDPVVPKYVQYWDLTTGSQIAFRKIPAQGFLLRDPVIYLHGGPGGGFVTFKPLVEALSPLSKEGFDIYIYDQVGGGLSERLEDINEYTLNRHIADLDSIRKQIGSDAVILIGESFGAVLAANYIDHYPGKVKKCIIVSPGELNAVEWKDKPRGFPRDRISRKKQAEMKSALKSHLPRYLFLKTLIDINPLAGYNFVREQEADTFFNLVFSFLTDGFVCNPENIREKYSFNIGFWVYTMLQKNLIEHNTVLKRNTLPALLIRGECDYIVPEVADQYKTVFTNINVLNLSGAGHIPYLEKPDLFTEALLSFLLENQ